MSSIYDWISIKKVWESVVAYYRSSAKEMWIDDFNEMSILAELEKFSNDPLMSDFV